MMSTTQNFAKKNSNPLGIDSNFNSTMKEPFENSYNKKSNSYII